MHPVKRQRITLVKLRCVFVITDIIFMPFRIFPSPTMTEQLGVCCLLEYDNGRPERREGHIQTTAAGKGPELWGEVLQVGPRGAAQEQEHVVVEALCPCTIDYYIRHCQYLEKKGVDIYRERELRQK